MLPPQAELPGGWGVGGPLIAMPAAPLPAACLCTMQMHCRWESIPPPDPSLALSLPWPQFKYDALEDEGEWQQKQLRKVACGIHSDCISMSMLLHLACCATWLLTSPATLSALSTRSARGCTAAGRASSSSLPRRHLSPPAPAAARQRRRRRFSTSGGACQLTSNSCPHCSYLLFAAPRVSLVQ